MIESKLDRKGRRSYGAPYGMKGVIFIDNINMPKIEKYGA
ncbi:MAG: hypothetical protein IPK55_15385 [Streptococcus sp.]|nr:hypothetical protein [Streptococcus sp.]